MRQIFICVVIALALCSTAVLAQQQYTIVGSKTMYSMNVALAKRFEQTHQGVKVQIVGEGTGVGIEAVIHKKADAAAITRALRPDEKKALRAAIHSDGEIVPIALEGISIYLHPRNPVSNLSADQVIAIFAGKITNWNSVGGADAPIHVYAFDNTTGRYWYLYEDLMNKTPFVKSARYTEATPPSISAPEGLARREEQMLSWVSQDPNAIGFGDLKKVRIVKIAKVAGFWPTPDDLRAGRYPFARRLVYFMSSAPSGALSEFARWAPKQADIIRDAGFVPVQ